MTLVCPSCGKENRDNARFCRGCARALERVGDGVAPADEARDRARALRRARRRKAAANAPASPARSRWAGVVLAAVFALGLGWWFGAHQKATAPAQAAGLGALALSPSAVAAMPPPSATAAASNPDTVPVAPVGVAVVTEPTAAAAVDRLRQSVELLEREDRAHVVALEQQRRKASQDRLRAEEARRRTDALSAAAASSVPTPAPAPTQAPAPAVVAAAPATAMVAATVSAPGVDQLCAASGNVFARDLCRIRECGKASFARDPVCVRFRQMDEARRLEADNR